MSYLFDPPEPRVTKAILLPIQQWGQGFDGRVVTPWWRVVIGNWASWARWKIWRIQGGRYFDEQKD